MEMKECSVFPEAPESLEPHHQIVWCHIRTLTEEAVPLWRGAVGVFYNPSRLSMLYFVLCNYRYHTIVNCISFDRYTVIILVISN